MTTPSSPAITTPDLLIVGGDQDYNLIRLMQKCGERKMHYHACLQGKSGTPEIVFNVFKNTLEVNGQILKPKSVFIRGDVFAYMEDKNPATWQSANDWYVVFFGWLMANPDIKIFNRQHINEPRCNKLATLLMAKQLGMDIPETYFTNTVSFINEKVAVSTWIQKPADGGDNCYKMQHLLPEEYPNNRVARPLILQEGLEFPELRLFRVGKKFIALNITSQDLDYRESKTSIITECDVPAHLATQLEKLSDQMGLDFCAADFKTCPKTKKLLLLEVNTGPMFSGFDTKTHGKLINAMLDELMA